jgi:hypothetical protein
MRAAALISDPAEARASGDTLPARFTVAFARNTRGWAGTGTLELIPNGLRFAARRGGFLHYARSRESADLPFSRLTSVLREGHLIRLQFRRSPSASIELLEFSAGESATAATILGHLPTALAVELDHTARAKAVRNPRRTLGVRLLLAGLLVVGVAAVVLSLRDEAVPATASRPQASTAPRVPVEPPAMPADDLAALRADLDAAQSRTVQLRKQFGLELERLMAGEISQDDFALTLDRGLIRAWGVEGTERSARARNGGTRARALELMALSADSWSLALTTYVEALRTEDPEVARKAFAAMNDADEFERQAYALLWDAEATASRAAGQP